MRANASQRLEEVKHAQISLSLSKHLLHLFRHHFSRSSETGTDPGIREVLSGVSAIPGGKSMVATSSSSSSSCASFNSLDDVVVKPSTTVKFVCSHGGRILPRYPDGRLRYVGGDTRVIAFNRLLPFSELQLKLGELCGEEAVSLRCQLPSEDLDALVSITSDEDLANLIEEYDLTGSDRRYPLKIRAFLHPKPTKSPKSPSPVASRTKASFRHPGHSGVGYSVHQNCSPAMHFIRYGKSDGDLRHHGFPASACHCQRLVHLDR